MAQVFSPRRAIYIPASGGHPKNTEYRVAWGFEQWGESPVAVTKVQMVYNGRVAGMLSPSYPDDTLDEKAVIFALKLLKEGWGTSSKKSKDVLVLAQVDSIEQLEGEIEKMQDAIYNMHLEIYTPPSGVSPIVSVVFKEKFLVEKSLYALLFKVDVS
ncbi:hypothetical protein [Anoxybacillus sp. J5B_2022]|uniref:hypothetical protein n=1 Tax=Anoxybacillus sp. J5B_2022 TaxID=3003246 RepID=UPI0022867DEA|nr:hypothetical protein [Anoxybacillus sp. J5B_2022]MCZ0754405.1 hypothetical protein [Anoxybacillus sp. J5B_2022]